MDDIAEARFKALESKVDGISTDLKDLLFIFNGAKAGARVIIALGKIAKWVGSIALAVAAVWAVVSSIKTGVPPSISN